MSDSFVTPWTVAHQAPLPMDFSRQEYWSRLPFSSPGDLPNPGIEPISCIGRWILFCLSHLGSPSKLIQWLNKNVFLTHWKSKEGRWSSPPLGDIFCDITVSVFYVVPSLLLPVTGQKEPIRISCTHCLLGRTNHVAITCHNRKLGNTGSTWQIGWALFSLPQNGFIWGSG